MPDNAACFFRNERNRQCMIGSQGADDELLGLTAVRMRQEGSPSHLLDGIFV